MKRIITTTLAIALLVVAPMVTNAQLKCYSLKAPEKTIEGMKKLAIMNFEDRKNVNWSYYSTTNDYGSQLVDYMTGMLLEEHRGVYARGENYMERYKTNVYTVVERGELDKIMAEQSLGASGAVSDGDAAAVGKLLGLDVIISGGYTTDVKTTTKTNSRKNSKTGAVSYSYSATKTATVEVTMKIISVETGQILSLTTKTNTAKKTASSSKNSSSARSSLPSDQSLISTSMKSVALQLVSHFTPVFTYQALEVEKPKVKDYKDEFKEAKSKVKEKDLSSAFAIVKGVYDADPYDAAMAHNMGVLYEAVGNYDQSIQYHTTAYELDDSKEHKKALERAMDSKEALDELGKLGVEITPYMFDESAGAKLNIEKVTTAGKKKDRVTAYNESNKGSGVAAMVPGDTEFEVLAREGSFVKVKLLGGKEGWISKTDLDK
ncbi:MAG: CsgG/HfaB family protein [Salibacteraceae bacterium]